MRRKRLCMRVIVPLWTRLDLRVLTRNEQVSGSSPLVGSNACHRLLEQEKEAIENQDTSVKAFNVGINDGEVAGQTIFHCHIHLMPRRRGDVEKPMGGRTQCISWEGSISLSAAEHCTRGDFCWSSTLLEEHGEQVVPVTREDRYKQVLR
jgi:hypothetical protein